MRRVCAIRSKTRSILDAVAQTSAGTNTAQRPANPTTPQAKTSKQVVASNDPRFKIGASEPLVSLGTNTARHRRHGRLCHSPHIYMCGALAQWLSPAAPNPLSIPITFFIHNSSPLDSRTEDNL
jgi:hypothetical protein